MSLFYTPGVQYDIMNPDVLHVVYYGVRGHSISRVVDNIIANAPEFRQDIFRIKENWDDLWSLVEERRPLLLHLHFNIPVQLPRLSFKPVLIQTVHEDSRSCFREIADQIVCIHNEAALKNPECIVIENTVDVKGITHSPIIDKCYGSFRFFPDRVNSDVLRVYSQIQQNVDLYGYIPGSSTWAYAEKIINECSKYPNICCKEWTAEVESYSRYKLLCNYYAENNPKYCFGLNVMEAASMGIPVVTVHRQQENSIYLVDGYNGFIVKDEREFIQKSNAVFDSETLYEDLREAARQHKISIKNTMPEHYASLYRSHIP
jgi:glycosyltransferase involved in cell wall biosynthesis